MLEASSTLSRECKTDEVESSVGIISSIEVDRTGCGSLLKPLTLKGSQGQRIRISLTDFAWHSDSSGTTDQCKVYGYVSEADNGRNHTICGGLSREREIYTSSSNRIELQIRPREARGDGEYFLLSYQGKEIASSPIHDILACSRTPHWLKVLITADETDTYKAGNRYIACIFHVPARPKYATCIFVR